MSDVTPAAKHRRNPLRRLLDLLDRLVSARTDAEARRRGHTVTRIPGTRVQVYSDPRWQWRRELMLDGIDDVEFEPGLSAGERS